jgi:ATP-dependent Clp protease protease subunit
MTSGYRIVSRNADTAEMYLYGPIGATMFGDGVSAKQVANDLKKVGNVKTIDLRINSEGGDVFDGKAIYSLLVENKAKVRVHIDGLAASAASFIAMAGNEINISEGGFIMIHDAYAGVMGRAEEMRQMADLLDSVNGTIVDVYAARTKQDKEKIKKWMAAETWFTGAEAMQNGFATSMVENLKVAASIRNPKQFKNLPNVLHPNRAKVAALLERIRS